jgi:hypothetical protein
MRPSRGDACGASTSWGLGVTLGSQGTHASRTASAPPPPSLDVSLPNSHLLRRNHRVAVGLSRVSGFPTRQSTGFRRHMCRLSYFIESPNRKSSDVWTSPGHHGIVSLRLGHRPLRHSNYSIHGWNYRSDATCIILTPILSTY